MRQPHLPRVRTGIARLFPGVIFGLLHASLARALPDVTLWVVQPPGQLVAFDLSDFSGIGGVRIPPVAFNDPSKLFVNGHGQILVQLDANKVWLWNGTEARTLPASPTTLRDSSFVTRAGRRPVRQWMLGDDGNSLFVVEGVANEYDEVGPDSSAAPLRMRVTNLSQQPREDVFADTLGPCQRSMLLDTDTEPCPRPDVWAPDGVVRGCVVLTRWEPVRDLREGTSPEAMCRRTRYLRTTAGWKTSDLEESWGEPLLDISFDGAAWVQAQLDDGCCGWSNGSSDQTTFGDADTAEVVFDEWSLFGNKDYDVSFSTTDARIAPDARHVALSVRAEGGPDQDIHLSSEGHADSLELKSIRASLADLPLVEVVETRPRSIEILRLPRAELVGWASDSELVVVEQRRVVIVNVLTKQRRRSDITVRTGADVVVVRR